jgi:hypothetical protein
VRQRGCGVKRGNMAGYVREWLTPVGGRGIFRSEPRAVHSGVIRNSEVVDPAGGGASGSCASSLASGHGCLLAVP